ncbi:MAG: MerR family transcriptional regulator [Clostridiales bacterium]|nr:MerR family transcriptional regulator [Clostridiales bacterium]
MAKQKIYRMGEFAQRLGVSRDLIKYYEKHHILTPQREAGNQYRYYYHNQSSAIFLSRRLQNTGCSLREIEGLLNEADPAETEAATLRQIQGLERELRLKSLYLEKLRQIRPLQRQAAEGTFDGSWATGPRPALTFLPFSAYDRFLELGDADLAALADWVDATPAADFCGLVRGGTLTYGFSIPQEQAQALGLTGSGLVALPPCQAFWYAMQTPRRPLDCEVGSEAEEITLQTAPALAKLAWLGLTGEEPICVFDLFESHAEGQFCYYQQVSIPLSV